MTQPLVSAVIVSFNTRDLLRRCLASLVDNPRHLLVAPVAPETGVEESTGTVRDGAPSVGMQAPTACQSSLGSLTCEILVVDNGSHDGSPEMVQDEFPKVQLIKSDANLGFACATNLGLRSCRGRLPLMLNPDTEVIGDALPRMADFLLKNERVAATGPSLIYPDGSCQHAAFHFPTLWMSFFDFFPTNHRFVNSRLNGRYPVSRDGRPFPIDHPLGAAIMVRRKALDEIGPLDERFFMYCEEVDWCIRARRAGWLIYQVPSARVVHHSGQSTGQMREEMLVELHRSRYRLFRKHYSRGFVLAHRTINCLGLLRRTLEALIQARRGRISRDQLDRRLWAYRVIRGL